MEWRHEYQLRVTVTEEGDATVARFAGALDPIAILAFRRHVTIPATPGGEVVLDLTDLEDVDMSGIREIRRIQADVELAGATAYLRGMTADTQRLLEYATRSGQPMSRTG